MSANFKAVNDLYFRRRKAIILTASAGSEATPVSQALVATFAANANSYGYIPDAALLEALSALPRAAFITEAEAALAILAEASGENAMKRVTPMYPNFPKQVMEASEAELFINAILHYLLGVLPEYEAEERAARWDFAPYKTVGLGRIEDLNLLVNDLFASKLSWGPAEQEDLFTILAEVPAVFTLSIIYGGRPENRENRAWLWDLTRGSEIPPVKEKAALLLKDSNDVLRAAVVLSGGSASLEPVTQVHGEKHGLVKFKTFSRAERRFFLAIIDADKHARNEFAKRPGLWKRLGEKLHPGDFKSIFPQAFAAFGALREGTLAKPNSKVEVALESADLSVAVEVLAGNPGAFVRRVDHLLRLASTDAEGRLVLDGLVAAARDTSSNVLWQAFSRLNQADEAAPFRAIYPKGSVSRAVLIPEVAGSSVVPREYAAALILAAVGDQYAQRSALEGTFFIDPILGGLKVPNAIRNAEASSTPLGRGSRVKLPDFEGTSNVRLFTHWKDQSKDSVSGGDPYWGGRVDVDLSGVYYDADFNTLGAVWYGDLRASGITHSGDITSAPNGAVEYLDIDVAKVLKAQPSVRYVAISIRSYTGQTFDTIPESFAGVQVLGEDMQAGKLFDAKNVTLKFSVASKTTATIPLMFDLLTGEMVWVDMQEVSGRRRGSNVRQAPAEASDILRAVLTKSAPTIGDVLTANVAARGGVLVASAEDADTVLTFDADGLTVPMDELLANWL